MRAERAEKISFLQENVTLRLAPGPMTFVKFVRWELALARAGVTSDRAPLTIPNCGPQSSKAAAKKTIHNIRKIAKNWQSARAECAQNLCFQ